MYVPRSMTRGTPKVVYNFLIACVEHTCPLNLQNIFAYDIHGIQKHNFKMYIHKMKTRQEQRIQIIQKDKIN